MALYDVLIEWREGDDLWHGVTTTRANNFERLFQKITRLAPFAKITAQESDQQECKAELEGNIKCNGIIKCMMLPELNNGVYADRVLHYTDGKHDYTTDLTLIEEDAVAHETRTLLGEQL